MTAAAIAAAAWAAAGQLLWSAWLRDRLAFLRPRPAVAVALCGPLVWLRVWLRARAHDAFLRELGAVYRERRRDEDTTPGGIEL